MTWDLEWWLDSPGRPRQVQRTLIFHGLRLPPRAPFGQFRKHSDGRYHLPDWAKRQRDASAEPLDDPGICPPTVVGQLRLFATSRRLTDRDATKIRDRAVAEQLVIDPLLDTYAEEHGYDKSWRFTARGMIRLAIAVSRADGKLYVDEEVLAALPRFRGPTAEILRQAGLLDPACKAQDRRIGPSKQGPRGGKSCLICEGWGTRRWCASCRGWLVKRDIQPGLCERCGRDKVPVSRGRCRACDLHVREHGQETARQDWVQLWIADPVVHIARQPRSLGFSGPDGRRRKIRAAQQAQPPRGVSPHLLRPGQLELFAAQRDWAFALTSGRLPGLTPSAEALMVAFRQEAGSQQGWADSSAITGMKVLLSWLGADAPIPEADIRALGREERVSARRVLRFLTARDLVVPDPERQSEPRQHAVYRLIEGLPDGIGGEVRQWVMVMRGQGRREHSPRPYKTIRNYLAYLLPVLEDWTGSYCTLRQVTREDVLKAIEPDNGPDIHHRIIAIRSLFKALRQERLIFADPTRGISLPKTEIPPQPLPSDRLAGLLDKVEGAAVRLVTTLIAIHALGNEETVGLLLEDMSLPRGRMTVRRGYGRRRTVFLDEVTRNLLDQWLKYRAQRWPSSPNPHLLVTQQTAHGAEPMHPLHVYSMLKPLGISPTRLRQDRILDEAKYSADPIHLMKVFGISDSTAMKYIYAAHPDRQSVIPR